MLIGQEDIKLNYQGMKVNFSQVSNSDLLLALQSTNRQVAKNSDNLVKMGKDMTIMGKNDTYFGNAITNLDNQVRNLLSAGTGGMSRQQVENIVEDYHGDDIEMLYTNHAEQENRITDGFNERKDIQGKVEKMFSDHDKFYATLGELGKTDTTLGEKLVEAKNERNRIEAKIGQGGKDCGFLGINCLFDNFNAISSTALLAGAGLAAYLLFGGKK